MISLTKLKTETMCFAYVVAYAEIASFPYVCHDRDVCIPIQWKLRAHAIILLREFSSDFDDCLLEQIFCLFLMLTKKKTIQVNK